MKILYISLLALIINCDAFAGNGPVREKGEIVFAKALPSADLKRGEVHSYAVKLKKGNRYVFSVYQNGIDVVVKLVNDQGVVLAEKDSPNGKKGFERLAYKALLAGNYKLQVTALDDASNSASGKYDTYVAEQSGALVAKLEAENKKEVQTLDIDHFWEAYDNLKNCKTLDDSIRSIQTLYIDRATEGFEEFMLRRPVLTAPAYIRIIKQYPKFYASVRTNTLATKKAVPLVQAVFSNFRKLYPNFKPVKVNFAIGTLSTGGTVGNNYVLVGSEMMTANNTTNLSEFDNSALGKIMSTNLQVEQLIENIVAHEAVHIQQVKMAADAERCVLLGSVMLEGFCDFISEKVTGNPVKAGVHEYGNKREKELWEAFSADPCNGNKETWLYNFDSVKDGVPADLGYYMGYKIAESYYNHQKDKKQAIVDIIEMNNPKEFLEKSKYAEKFK